MDFNEEQLDQVKETVEAVARFDEREHLRRSPFHMSPCGGCGAPSFQQPCSLCGFYPYGADKGHWSPEKATYEQFADMVERSGPGGRNGTIATWHARGIFKGRVGMTAESAAELGERAAVNASGIECCDARTAWDVVAAGRTSVTRQPKPLHVHHGWEGLFEARGVAEGRYGRFADPNGINAVRKAAEAWVEAVHSEDTAGMAAAMDEAIEACAGLAVTAGKSGNLSWARGALGKARDELEGMLPTARV